MNSTGRYILTFDSGHSRAGDSYRALAASAARFGGFIEDTWDGVVRRIDAA